MVNIDKKFAMTAAMILLVVVVLSLALFCLLSKIDEKDKAIGKIKNSLASCEERIRNSKDLKKGLKESEGSLAKIESVFFSKESVLDFIRRMEYLAQKSKIELSLQSVNFSEDNNKKPVINLTLVGQFADIYYYLSLLENDYYRISIEKAYIQKIIDKKSEADNWESGLEIKLLSFK